MFGQKYKGLSDIVKMHKKINAIQKYYFSI